MWGTGRACASLSSSSGEGTADICPVYTSPGPSPSLPHPSRLLWESLGLCDGCLTLSASRPCSSRSSVQHSPDTQARILVPICDPICLSRAKDTIKFCWFSQHCYPHSLLSPAPPHHLPSSCWLQVCHTQVSAFKV